jgi:hypothetical protein
MDRIQAAFPDFRDHLEEIISEDDRTFTRLTYRGTHHGTVFGIPPTGRRVEYAGTAVSRFRGEKIAEVWVLGDVPGLLQQLRESASYIVIGPLVVVVPGCRPYRGPWDDGARAAPASCSSTPNR